MTVLGELIQSPAVKLPQFGELPVTVPLALAGATGNDRNSVGADMVTEADMADIETVIVCMLVLVILP